MSLHEYRILGRPYRCVAVGDQPATGIELLRLAVRTVIPGYRSAQTARRSRIVRVAFSLLLGSVPIGFAQTNHDHANGIQLASGGAPEGDSASRCVSIGDFTNQHLTLRSVPAPKRDPAPGLSYAMPPSPEGAAAESNPPSPTHGDQLATPVLTASPQGWQLGGAGVLNYNAENRRWRFVVGYAPDLDALRDNLRDNFGDLRAFNLAWQFSLGRHKPASWAEVKTGSEDLRRSAPR